jgi:alkanesulfonate monooxygenase SsuD/methylene tetrahydromethanopterin reductase-like flavin-dependent oxidoreductase (luciferase family)
VYVGETNEQAMSAGLLRASQAYEGFLSPPQPGETFDQRVRAHAKKFIGRGEPGASEIMANLFDPDYLMKHDLVFIDSPDTVAGKIRAAAEAGVFNTFMGRVQFL